MNVKQVSSSKSDGHKIILLHNCNVYGCRYNLWCQLGIGNDQNQSLPVRIPLLSDVKQISCGIYHSVVLLNNGDVYAFGINNNGQLGIGSCDNQCIPVKIESL